MTHKITAGQKYCHYKGNNYTIIAIAYDCEDLTPIVVYQAEYDTTDLGSKPIFTRTLASFTDFVALQNGQTTQRFTLL